MLTPTCRIREYHPRMSVSILITNKITCSFNCYCTCAQYTTDSLHQSIHGSTFGPQNTWSSMASTAFGTGSMTVSIPHTWLIASPSERRQDGSEDKSRLILWRRNMASSRPCHWRYSVSWTHGHKRCYL